MMYCKLLKDVYLKSGPLKFMPVLMEGWTKYNPYEVEKSDAHDIDSEMW